MKLTLVEILARNVHKWPAGATHAKQSTESKRIFLYGINNSKYDFDFHFFASDAALHVEVTRAQWEAERARILAESQPERDPVISEEHREKIAKDWWSKQMQNATLEVMPEENPQYEQKLWDQVASQIFVKFSLEFESASESKDTAINAMDAADAFMAERAKRLKR